MGRPMHRLWLSLTSISYAVACNVIRKRASHTIEPRTLVLHTKWQFLRSQYILNNDILTRILSDLTPLPKPPRPVSRPTLFCAKEASPRRVRLGDTYKSTKFSIFSFISFPLSSQVRTYKDSRIPSNSKDGLELCGRLPQSRQRKWAKVFFESSRPRVAHWPLMH